jgi:hypothetical protein
MVKDMPDEKKKDLRHPETFFLPPLRMILSFFDKESRQREKKLALSNVEGKKDVEKQEETVGKNVEKLIEKLREKEE